MKLVRHGESGKERPGLIDSRGEIRDLSAILDDVNGSTLSDDVLQSLHGHDASSLPVI